MERVNPWLHRKILDLSVLRELNEENWNDAKSAFLPERGTHMYECFVIFFREDSEMSLDMSRNKSRLSPKKLDR